LLCVFLFPSRAAAQANAGAPAKTPAYLDPQWPIDQRVNDLVSRMTLEEKASQVVHQASAIPRLNVPRYNWWTEALHGVAAGTATVFPEPIGLAATFDAPLIHEMGVAIGTEARAKHHEDIRQRHFDGVGLDFWAPNINIFRDPRWGRGQETYGEDPFLTARMAVAYVTGMQGDDSKYLRVIATPKHYAVHSGPDPLRHTIDVNVSKHDEEDTYLPAFRAAVMDGKAGSVMCAYNNINGEPACANTFLQEDQLRSKWGFQGYVVSDCDAVHDIFQTHHYTKTLEEAAAVSMKRGTDLDCNDPGNNYSAYVNAVKQGLLSEMDLDIAVKRLMRARMELGMFDPPEMVKYAQTPISENDSQAHRQLALKLARETMVLLKNDGTLPLKATPKKIAVIGPVADSTSVLDGNYNGTPSRATTALDGIRKQFPNAEVTFEPGTEFLRGGLPVPAAWLTTEDGQPGIKGDYFQGTELQGAPMFTRIDKDVNFEFNGTSPGPGLGPNDFSVRWRGVLTPLESGPCRLGVTGDDGYRLWLDGKLLVEDWSTHGPSTKYADVTLVKGRKYDMKLEYFQEGGGAVAKLSVSWPADHPVDRAVDAAKQADLIIAVVGISPDLENEETGIDIPGFKGGDRTRIDLPQEEQELLEAVQATGKPLVVVLTNGSALAVNWAQAHANAILDSWYSGEEGGTAIAETLAGLNNPAGRLPVTFYKGVEQLPPFEDYSMKGRTYRYFEGQPLYPFGYGLSYSKFAYSGLKLSAATITAGSSLGVDADVRNTGPRGGDEVTELYLGFPNVEGAPIRALRGFARIYVAAGQTKHVHFILNARDLSMVNESGDRIVAPGKYQISLGGGQPGTGAAVAEAQLSITGNTKLRE
jgi:beta-glucosidase